VLNASETVNWNKACVKLLGSNLIANLTNDGGQTTVTQQLLVTTSLTPTAGNGIALLNAANSLFINNTSLFLAALSFNSTASSVTAVVQPIFADASNNNNNGNSNSNTNDPADSNTNTIIIVVVVVVAVLIAAAAGGFFAYKKYQSKSITQQAYVQQEVGTLMHTPLASNNHQQVASPVLYSHLSPATFTSVHPTLPPPPPPMFKSGNPPPLNGNAAISSLKPPPPPLPAVRHVGI
jgi:uncharacterized protein YneF (UPF0154 family)